MAHGGSNGADDLTEENGLVPMEFRDSKRFSTDSNGVDRRCMEPDSVGHNGVGGGARRFVEPRPIASYPHSTPASPTMMDSRNLNSLGLLRHLARLEQHQPREAHENSRVGDNSRLQSMEDGLSQDALDYRFQTTEQSEAVAKKDKERSDRLQAFRPESAPTVLDMSPEATRLSIDFHKHESLDGVNGFRNLVGIQPVSSANDLMSDCLNKSLGSSGVGADGQGGRYNCDECGKLFRHPGSLQHHRHIHRGTHRCPSCGKAFSRRWDMERHLNKSKYGCPANRFGSSPSHNGSGANAAELMASPNPSSNGIEMGSLVAGGGAQAHQHLLSILPHSTQTNSL